MVETNIVEYHAYILFRIFLKNGFEKYQKCLAVTGINKKTALCPIPEICSRHDAFSLSLAGIGDYFLAAFLSVPTSDVLSEEKEGNTRLGARKTVSILSSNFFFEFFLKDSCTSSLHSPYSLVGPLVRYSQFFEENIDICLFVNQHRNVF
jgi:hypothetical protein